MIKQRYFGVITGSLMIILLAYFDFSQPLGVAGGIPYVIPIIIGFFSQESLLVLIFGLIGIALTVIGFYLSAPGCDLSIVLKNRGLAIIILSALMTAGYFLVKRQVSLENKLLLTANTDALTGISSRRIIIEELERRVPEAQRYNLPLTVLLMDIDHFKQINDSYGHLKGDRVLKLISQKCKEIIRGIDLLGRYGGEEFLTICPNTSTADAAVLAERIRAMVENLSTFGEGSHGDLTISIGVASLSNKEMSAQQLIHLADRALYVAKREGRNKVVIYDETKHKETL